MTEFKNKKLIPVVVSGPMMRQLFHSCEPEYIRNVCHGRCCESSKGILVVINKREEKGIVLKGGTVVDGKLDPSLMGKCPFKTHDHLCGIHHTGKPFGCKASPFTLNNNDILIVRNRYRMLVCYKAEGSQPAYISHKGSLITIFGEKEADRIIKRVIDGDDRILAEMKRDVYDMLKENDAAKKKKV